MCKSKRLTIFLKSNPNPKPAFKTSGPINVLNF